MCVCVCVQVQRCYHELGVSEARSVEAEKRAQQAANDMRRMREGAKEEEEETNREHDKLRTEVRLERPNLFPHQANAICVLITNYLIMDVK